jgi:hypothetical protein
MGELTYKRAAVGWAIRVNAFAKAGAGFRGKIISKPAVEVKPN